METKQNRIIRLILLNFGCAALYFGFGKFGLILASINETVSPFWPASGLALALSIRYGIKILPAIFVGALITNYSISLSGFFMASVIALGNTSEAHIGQLVYQWIKNRFAFLSELDSIFRLCILAAVAPVSASLIGTLVLSTNPSNLNFNFWQNVGTWWAGDMLGILCVFPIAHIFLKKDFHFRFQKIIQLGFIATLFFIATYYIFKTQILIIPTVLFPLIIFCFLIFGELQTRASLVAIILATLYATTCGYGPFTSGTMNTNLMNLVLFLSSLCLVSHAIPPLLSKQFKKIALVSLAAGWVVMSITFIVVVGSATEQDNIRIKTSFDKKIDNIQDRMKIYENALHSGVGLFQASSEVTPEEWREFVTGTEILKSFPGIRGLGVIYKIKKSQEKKFTQKAKSHWKIKDFKIKEVPDFLMKHESDEQQKFFTRPIKKPDRYVITYIEPIENNRSARGLDVGSELGRRIAADHSEREGKFAVTSPIILIQGNQRSFGFLAYVPIKKDGVQGWVYAPFSSSEFFGQALKIDNQFHLRIYDTLPFGEEAMIFSSNTLEGRTTTWSKAKNSTIQLGGRNFRVEWVPNMAAFATKSSTAAWSGFLGVIFTLLLAGVVVGLKSSEHRALTLVDLKTKDLNSKNLFLQDLMDFSPIGIFRTDPEGKVIFLNRQWLDIAGLKLYQALGTGWIKCLHPDDKDKVLLAWKNSLVGKEFELEYRYINQKSKSIHWVFGRAVRLVNEDSKFLGLLGTVEDITEIKNQQQKLLESSRLSSLGEMAAGIAHEINNPLAIISGSASLVTEKIQRSSITTEEITGYLQKIDSTSHRIAKIIRGLRAYAREGTNDPFEWTSLNTILDNTLSLCSEKFKVHHVELRTNYNPSVMLLCREIQISQVLINLLNNAYDAIQELDEKWVEVKTEETDDSFNIKITDSGSGISGKHTDSIMRPFFTTKEVGKGTGLGLSISSSIIEQHGGQLYLDQKSMHTSFIISFPKSLFKVGEPPEKTFKDSKA